jgi:hypothetical protein
VVHINKGLIHDAVQTDIDAASDAVSALPSGQCAWGEKEHQIAGIAAREAVAALVAKVGRVRV